MSTAEGLGERLAELVAELKAAVETVPDVRVYTDPGASIAPPGVVISPPRLTFAGYNSDPLEASFLLVVCVAANERAMPRLWELVPQVAAAVHDHTEDAVVRQAQPGAWTAGGTELPCYELTVETNL